MLKLTNIEIFMTSGGSICECYCSHYDGSDNPITSDNFAQLELFFTVKAAYKDKFIGFFKNEISHRAQALHVLNNFINNRTIK